MKRRYNTEQEIIQSIDKTLDRASRLIGLASKKTSDAKVVRGLIAETINEGTGSDIVGVQELKYQLERLNGESDKLMRSYHRAVARAVKLKHKLAEFRTAMLPGFDGDRSVSVKIGRTK